ncbi:hypothetical protein [Rhizobium giardinii]|uniref:CD-NTase-associated protein 15 domain-containing protein n=1 Tax=Rhizobium giardinii TaxID=56731 RepID=A0A7W8X934_9HYPH|nr:hypothetical protein [Rhizobium giardinii]MBB5535173.1 hypothetical protein [Rhizobium giardinii]
MLTVILGLAVVIVILFMATTSTGAGDIYTSGWRVLRWVSTYIAVVIGLIVMAWRWSSRVQRAIFPYLGGKWVGKVHFSGAGGEEEHRDVTLHIRHTPFSIKLILESQESISWTLAVQASRSADIDDYKLYYVYSNHRREGGIKRNFGYRGVAILRVSMGSKLELIGDYFTETHRRGRLKFEEVKSNPWWMLWQ